MKVKTHIAKTLMVFLLIAFLFPTYNASAQSKTETKVYVTNTGTKYHKKGCSYLSKSSNETTLETAKKDGYTACYRYASKTKSSATQSSKSVATQCTGTTQAGNRCKRKTKNGNGRCYQH